MNLHRDCVLVFLLIIIFKYNIDGIYIKLPYHTIIQTDLIKFFNPVLDLKRKDQGIIQLNPAAFLAKQDNTNICFLTVAELQRTSGGVDSVL